MTDQTPTTTDTNSANPDVNIQDTEERSALIARAKMLGLEFPPNIYTSRLRELVNGAIAAKPEPVVVASEPAKLTARQEALKLIRVNVVCMNPSKVNLAGEIITAGNAVCPTQRKFVPFNTPEGFHIPNIIYNVMREKQFQMSITKQGAKGDYKEMRMMPEYSIQVLPPLTEQQLEDLRIAQAAAKQTN